MQEVVFKYSGFRRELLGEIEKNRIWCPQHFSMEFELESRILTSWHCDGAEFERIGETVFYSSSHRCIAGRADDETRSGNFSMQAQLFLISPDGFAAVNTTRLRIAEWECSCSPPLSIEADVRGRILVECPCASALWLSEREYSLSAGRHEIEIAPFEIPAFEVAWEWIANLAQKK